MSDLISRQAVQEIVDRIGGMYPYRQIGNRDSYSQYNEAWTDAINRVDAELNSLPSAQPERPKCKWMIEGTELRCRLRCSCCSSLAIWAPYAMSFIFPNFCPSCGADMRKEGNDGKNS